MPESVERPSSRYRAYSKAFDVVRPAQIYRARRQARNGNPGRLWSILRHYKRQDPHVRAAMQSVRAPIVKQDVQLNLLEDSEEARTQRDVVRQVLTMMGIDHVIEDLIWGHWYGLRAHHLEWGDRSIDGSTYQAPIDAHRIPQEWIHARDENHSDGRSTLYVGRRPLSEYERGTLIVYQDEEISKYEEVDFTGLGTGMAAARFCVFSWYNVEDWASYNEAWATPSVIGTLLQGWNEDDKALLKQAVNNLGNDLRAIKTDQGKIELEWPEGSGNSRTYEELRTAANKAISVTIKSESLTDVEVGGGGSFAAARTTDGIRVDVAGGIKSRVVSPLNEEVIVPFTEMNWGRTLVQADIDVDTVQDRLQQVKVDRELSRMGLPLSREELYETYDRSPPEDEDDALTGGSGFDPLAGA